ncbi:DUF4010 domain-containing protein [Kibdelosporangium philippinense]
MPGLLAVNIATLVQMVAVTAVASPAVALRFLPAAAAGILVLLAEIGWLVWRQRPENEDGDTDPLLTRPMSLKSALVLAAVLVILLVTTRAAADWLGGGGALAAAAAGGLADAHASAVAAASLVPQAITVGTAVLACALALATNTVVKLSLAGGLGGGRFALRLAAWLAAPVVAVAVAVFFLV